MPVLLGLPWLAAVLGTLFTGVVSWLAMFLTKRIAIAVAVIAAFTALTAAFLLVIQGFVNAVSYSVPGAANIGFLVPPDLPALVATYTAARLAFWVYRWNIKIVQLRMF